MHKMLLLFVWICSLFVFPCYGMNATSARQALEVFCQGELSGSKELRREAIFSPEYERKVALNEFKGRVILPLYVDSLFVVDSTFYIQKVEVDSDTSAFAVVVYQRLARFVMSYKTAYGKIVEDAKADSVEYRLVKKKGKWLIFDPPALRISKDILIEVYKDDLYSFTDNWFVHATKDQLNYYNNQKIILEFLKKL